MPAKFWGPPNFACLEKDSRQALLESMRVKDQMFHYTMLNQLHLPFLFSSDAERKNEHAKITCANSSREILTGFIAFRAFNRFSASCRLADFLALVAGTTLVLVHLYGHRQEEKDNLFAHQRLGDRATMEQALESMEGNSGLNEDMLAARCARLLRQLLHIEADANQGHNYNVQKVQWSETGRGDERNVLFITVPYFGTIRFTHDGIRSMEMPKESQGLKEHITIGGIGSVQVANQVPMNGFTGASANSTEFLFDHDVSGNVSSPPHPRQEQLPAKELNAVSNAAHQPLSIVVDEFMQEEDLYPGATAGMTEWVFQGIDTTFFDNLIEEESIQVSDGGIASNWGQAWDSSLDRP